MKFEFSIDECCVITGGLREYFRVAQKCETDWEKDMARYADFSESWKYAADKAEFWHKVADTCNEVYFKILGTFIPEDL